MILTRLGSLQNEFTKLQRWMIERDVASSKQPEATEPSAPSVEKTTPSGDQLTHTLPQTTDLETPTSVSESAGTGDVVTGLPSPAVATLLRCANLESVQGNALFLLTGRRDSLTRFTPQGCESSSLASKPQNWSQ